MLWLVPCAQHKKGILMWAWLVTWVWISSHRNRWIPLTTLQWVMCFEMGPAMSCVGWIKLYLKRVKLSWSIRLRIMWHLQWKQCVWTQLCIWTKIMSSSFALLLCLHYNKEKSLPVSDHSQKKHTQGKPVHFTKWRCISSGENWVLPWTQNQSSGLSRCAIKSLLNGNLSSNPSTHDKNELDCTPL